jgi:hypothetical protein
VNYRELAISYLIVDEELDMHLADLLPRLLTMFEFRDLFKRVIDCLKETKLFIRCLLP